MDRPIVTTSQRGKPSLILNGYTYKLRRFLKKTNENNWECVKDGCKACVYTKSGSDGEMNVIRFAWVHGHDPAAENVISRRIISQSSKRRAEEDLMEKPSRILHLELEKNPEMVWHLKQSDVDYVRKNMYNARRKVMQTIPKNIEEALQQSRTEENIMVRRCQACNKVDNVNPDVTFHKFPSDAGRRRIWCSLLGFEQFEDLPKHPYICSDHFDTKDFSARADGKRYIRNDADPLPTHQMFDVKTTSASEFHDAEMRIRDYVTSSSSSNSQNEIEFEYLTESPAKTIPTSSNIRVPKLSGLEMEGILEKPYRDSTGLKTVGGLSTSEQKIKSSSCADTPPSIGTRTGEYDDSMIETEMLQFSFVSSSPTSLSKDTVDADKCFSQPIPKKNSTSSSTGLGSKLTPAQVEEICKTQTRDSVPSVIFTPAEIDELFKRQSRELESKRKSLPQVTTTSPHMKRKRKRGYIGDMDESDFSTPEQTSKNLEIIRTKMRSQTKKIRSLQQTVRRLKYRLNSMKTLVDYLKGEPLLPADRKTATDLLTNGYDQDETILNNIKSEDDELSNGGIPSNDDSQEPMDIKDEVDIEEILFNNEHNPVKEELADEIEYIKEEVSSIESDEEFEDGERIQS